MAENDVVIKVRVEDDGSARFFNELGEEIGRLDVATEQAQGGFTRLEARLTGLSSGVQLAKEAFNLLAGTVSTVFDGISRGAEVEDLSTSFQNLAREAGASGDALLNNLNAALSNTIPNLELMQQANELLIGGLAPDQIELVAKAARSLGEATGVSAKEGMNQLADSLLRGNDRALKTLGIVVDNDKAFRDFAETIGTTSEKLSEQAKTLAIREAALKALAEQTSRLGDVTDDAGDRLDQLTSTLSNAKDAFFQALSNNEALNQSLTDLGTALRNVDFKAWADSIGIVISAAVEATTAIANLLNQVNQFAAGTDQFTKSLGRSSENFTLFDERLQGVIDLLSQDTKEATSKAIAEYNRLGATFQKMTEYGDLSFAVVQALNDEFFSTGKEVAAAAKNYGLLADTQQKLIPKIQTTTKNLVDQNKVITDQKKVFDDAKKRAEELGKANEVFTQSLRKLLGNDAIPGVTSALDELAFEFVVGSKSADEIESAIRDLLKSFDGSPDEIKKFQSALEGAFDGVAEEIKKADEAAAQYFDNLESQAQDAGSEIGGILSDSLGSFFEGDIQGGFKSIFTDLGQLAGKSLGQSLGTSIGGAFGGGIGGQLGGSLGGLLGGKLVDGIASLFDNEDAGTTARKAADKFFADAFDANRLLVVIEGQLTQIKDLVFKGDTLFGGLSDFETGTFDDFFATLPDSIRQGFAGVGLAFEELLGVSEDISGQIAAVLANNIGGSLNNLQLLVKASGKSFEELQGAVVDAFNDGKISVLEAQSALNGLAQTMQDGIPDAVGATTQAFSNFFAAGSKGGLALIDSIQDVGFEAEELGITTFPALADQLIASGQFTSEQVQAVFGALAATGIDTIEELTNATTQQLLPALASLEAQGFLAESVNDANSLVDALDRLPSEKNLTINIKTNLDSNTQEAINSGALSELRGTQGPAQSV